MTADVFISYRGADRVLARKLENRLRSRWGSRVFRDESGLAAGRPWADELAAAMRDARVMLALVGPGWQVSTDPDKEDWVRKELATAIDGAKPILPVLVGNPDELKPKLGSMPEAFGRQAVIVGPELAGFDLHTVAKALRQLGAFATDNAWSLTSRRDDMVPAGALGKANKAIAKGRSLLVVGSSGSGRNALIRRLVANLAGDGHLVASYGLARCAEPRRTHAVISGWIRSLSATFQDLTSSYGGGEGGEALVKAVLAAGPDLLSRRVVKARTLLPLGNASHDQRILEAVRRPTERWAPFPPTRLMHQSRGVLEELHGTLEGVFEQRPMLVVDHFDSVDSVSADLVRDLLEKPLGRGAKSMGLIVAAYDCGPNARRTLRDIADEAASDHPSIERIDIDSTEAWGEPGANLQPWLDGHGVRLTETVANCLKDEPNPYRVLAKLWYLVDNGYVSEASSPATDASAATRGGKRDKFVVWDSTQQGVGISSPSEDRLLDHMIAEHVPIGFRKIVEAGALVGRTFPFHAAYFAAYPPTEDPSDENALSSRESEAWSERARQAWDDMTKIDPDHSVLSCYENDEGEKLVSLAQADLIGHLRNGVGSRTKRGYHERIAHYLVDPIEPVDDDEHEDTYHRAELAAKHWSLAERPRDAADAHRRAAEIAERSLAYRESKRNYESAIRLYTQLLADARDLTREHEDLLILSNCLYRVGQTTRLSGHPGKAEDRTQSWGATDYLEHALGRLADLKKVLLDESSGRWPDGVVEPLPRDIPGPNLVRHHSRLYDALSGHVHLELAQCHEAAVNECQARAGDELHICEECEKNDRLVRDRLFDALRHAEAARGEAGSRWLLASASARLAALLTEEALRSRRRWPVRSHNLAVEAFFHIERIIGLRVFTAAEQRELADPVAWAWRSAGRLYRHHACEPRIAMWAFRRMNDHGDNSSTAVDMVTDRWLGAFLLSICKRGEQGPEIEEARTLLERYRDWAIESGIVDSRTPSHLRLYLLELVKSKRLRNTKARKQHLQAARRHAVTDRHRHDCALFEALELALSPGRASKSSASVVDKFREAFPEQAGAAEAEVLRIGWTRLAGMLARRCPPLASLVEKLVKPVLPEEWDNAESELRHWADWARDYVAAWDHDPIQHPSLDHGIRRLASIRLPESVFEHASDTAERARSLLEVHGDRCTADEAADLHVLGQDVEYAALIHDWYVKLDPARMLTLASEWNLKVSGVEWSNPVLLHGRLAATALERMYASERELGMERYRRIREMVEHHCAGRRGATTLEKVFFLANALSESASRDWIPEEPPAGQPDWRRLAMQRGGLDRAYEIATRQKEEAVRNAGNAVLSRPEERATPPLDSTELPPATDDHADDGPTLSESANLARSV